MAPQIVPGLVKKALGLLEADLQADNSASSPIFATLSANSGQAELVDDQALVRLSTTRTATVLNIAWTPKRALEPAIGRVLGRNMRATCFP
jgi:hypothetical protein